MSSLTIVRSRSYPRRVRFGISFCVGYTVSLIAASSAFAYETVREKPDPTRLDVERLPPEAIKIDRDLYSHGWFVESHIGGRGFIGGVGRLSDPGLLLNIGVGYELFRWLSVRLSSEASIHATDAPRPPDPTVFEVVGFLAEVRGQLNLSARAALWLGAEGGMVFVIGKVLSTYGVQNANDVGAVYGGQIGFDWHMRSQHYSVGIASGARVYPSLKGFDGEMAIGVQGSGYIRYVF